MRTPHLEMSRLGELVGPTSDVSTREPMDAREGPRLAAKAVLHLLRARRHTLALGPAAATEHEPPDGQR